MIKHNKTVVRQTKASELSQHKQQHVLIHDLWLSLNNIQAVARNEWQQQYRSLAIWILLALNVILLAIEINLALSVRSYWNSSSFAINMASGAIAYDLLAIPFLFINIFTRDQRRGIYALLWVRPLSAIEYVLGKGLAVALVSVLICIVPLLFGWGIASWQLGALQPWQPWLQIGGVLLINVIAIAWLALLLIRLIGPLLGALLCAAIPIYLFFQSNRSLLNIENVNLINIYFAQSIAFGPDTMLLVAQRLFYAIMAAVFLIALALLFRFREPRSLSSRREMILTSGVGILLVITQVGSLLHFEATGQQYQDISAPAVQPSTAQFSHYSLAVTIDPASGRIGGTARFLLTPPTGGNDSRLIIGLLPALHIQQVAVAGQANEPAFSHNISYTTSAGWTTLNLAQTDYSQGKAIWLQVRYDGTYMVNRDNYSDARYGMFSGMSDQNTLTSYVGNGISFLGGNGGGIWYPLPWTQQIGQFGNRLPMDEVQLTFPATTTVVSSLVSPQHNADQQTITITPHGVLPLALIGAMMTPQQTHIDQMPVYYTGIAPDTQSFRSYEVAIHQTLNLETWLHADSQASSHWHAMVVPFLNQPVVGSGLLLLPELPLFSTTHLNLDDQTILTRFAGGEIARSWWLNAVQGEVSVNKVPPTLQSPQATLQFIPQAQTLDALANYSAAIATDKILGSGYFDREKTVCANTNNTGTSAAANLGIEQCASQVPALYYLQSRYGAQDVARLLQAFATDNAQQKATWSQFVTTASTILHHDVTPELTPYICNTSNKGSSAAKGKQGGSCLDTPQGSV